jgi:hypothetical protein
MGQGKSLRSAVPAFQTLRRGTVERSSPRGLSVQGRDGGMTNVLRRTAADGTDGLARQSGEGDRRSRWCRWIGALGSSVGYDRGRPNQMSDDVGDADHADQGVVLENRQQPDLMLVHQLQHRID